MLRLLMLSFHNYQSEHSMQVFQQWHLVEAVVRDKYPNLRMIKQMNSFYPWSWQWYMLLLSQQRHRLQYKELYMQGSPWLSRFDRPRRKNLRNRRRCNVGSSNPEISDQSQRRDTLWFIDYEANSFLWVRNGKWFWITDSPYLALFGIQCLCTRLRTTCQTNSL